MRHLDRTVAVACLVAGVVLLFTAAGFVVVERDLSSSVSYLLIAGVALLICYGLLAPKAVVQVARSRQARFGTLSVLVSAVVALAWASILAWRWARSGPERSGTPGVS